MRKVTNILQPRNRVSLKTIFNASVTGILLSFLSLSWLVFSNQWEFRNLFGDVAKNSLPDIVASSELYGLSARLLNSTGQLSAATSEAAMHLAEQEIAKNLQKLASNSNDHRRDNELKEKLAVITSEVIELQSLTRQKSLINQQISDRNQAIQALYEEASKPEFFSVKRVRAKDEFWVLQFSKMIIKANQGLNVISLQELREILESLNKDNDLLLKLSRDGENNKDMIRVSNELSKLLLQGDGLLSLKTQQLRLEGRIVGRGSFVHNLIQDYARLLEYKAQETEKKVTDKLSGIIVLIKSEIRFGIVVLAGTVLFLVLSILFIHKNVISRLRLLDSMVKKKMAGVDVAVELEGDDEISDLANTFRLYNKIIAEQKSELENISLTDALTNVANRRALDIRLSYDLKVSERNNSTVAILLVDIDCFKLYNDNYGHVAGDLCLKKIAGVLDNSLERSTDFVARYGGEEFVCVLPNTALAGAEELAADIIKSLANEKIPHEFSAVANHVTFSIGIAVSRLAIMSSPVDLLRQADKALYRAKNAGKNRYVSDFSD